MRVIGNSSPALSPVVSRVSPARPHGCPEPRRPSPALKPPIKTRRALAICISANKLDRDLSLRVRDILVDLGADALTAPTEPTPDQTPTDFNAQLDEVMTGSEGVIIVYGQTAPAWVQAQYVRARKALAQQRKGVWGALLDGPPLTSRCRHSSRNLGWTPGWPHRHHPSVSWLSSTERAMPESHEIPRAYPVCGRSNPGKAKYFSSARNIPTGFSIFFSSSAFWRHWTSGSAKSSCAC